MNNYSEQAKINEMKVMSAL